MLPFSPASLNSTFWHCETQAAGKKFPTQFQLGCFGLISVALQPRCLVSSATIPYHLVLGKLRRMARAFIILGISGVFLVNILSLHLYLTSGIGILLIIHSFSEQSYPATESTSLLTLLQNSILKLGSKM